MEMVEYLRSFVSYLLHVSVGACRIIRMIILIQNDCDDSLMTVVIISVLRVLRGNMVIILFSIHPDSPIP